MTTPLYPTAPVPDTPYNVQDSFKTISSPEFDSGTQVFRSLRSVPLFSATLTYGEHNNWNDVTVGGVTTLGLYTLYNFFVQMKGTATVFDFIDFNGWDNTPVGIQWPKLYVGVGTGASTTFPLPMTHSYITGVSSGLLYDNGTDITNNLWVSGAFNNPMWKFHAGAGENGRDTIEFQTAPPVGHILEWKAVGQRVIKAHFTTDNISVNAFTFMSASTGLTIKEVR